MLLLSSFYSKKADAQEGEMTSQGHTTRKWRGLDLRNMAPGAILLTTHYIASQNREPQRIVYKLRVNTLKTGEQVSFIGVSFQTKLSKYSREELSDQTGLLEVIFQADYLRQRRITKCRGRFKARKPSCCISLSLVGGRQGLQLF